MQFTASPNTHINTTMKRLARIAALIALAALTGLDSQLCTARAQGSLMPPPGAPAPVMKSLDQIEPRTPISAIPFTITNSGSYYATANLVTSSNSAGIIIAANDVTVDLNGFLLTTTHASPGLPGIHFTASVTNITVRNGSISRFHGGIFAFPLIRNILVSGIHVRSVSSGGIFVDLKSGKVVNCSVTDCGSTGIGAAVVENSTVHNTSGVGITAQNVVNSSALSAGFDGINAATVLNSTGSSSAGGYGIIASDSAMNSNGESATGVGLKATVAMNCTGQRPGGRAIEATVGNGCYAIQGTNLITHKFNMP